MMKKGFAFILLWVGISVSAQQDLVLMRVNGKEILRSEFEYLYNKKSVFPPIEQITLQEYVNLFVNFKLKVIAAEAAGMDTTRAFKEELEGYRRQLAESYLTDREVAERAARQMYDKTKLNNRGGQIHVKHIFKRLPQNISGYRLRDIQSRMDSIYESLMKSGSQAAFDTAVQCFSDEKESFWVSGLQMPTEFENVVFDLPSGGISRPFFTPQGIHIVKALERKDISFDEMKDDFVSRQARHYGMDKSLEALVEKLKKEYCYTPDKAGLDELLSRGSTDKNLFTLDGKVYSGKDFILFASAHPATVRRQLDGYIMKSVFDYEESRLEKKYPDFRLLMQEYREGMLLFEISHREVWGKAQVEAELAAYFKEHRSDYYWKTPCYKGVVLHCTKKRVGKQVRKLLKSIPEKEWNDAVRLTFNAHSEPQVQMEQGIFAPGDNLYVDEFIFKRGKTEPLTSFPFTVLLGAKLKGPEDYQEVRAALLTDYQNYLETRWMEQLRACGKVEINQEVLKTVNNH